jgi:hypothetical protein
MIDINVNKIIQDNIVEHVIWCDKQNPKPIYCEPLEDLLKVHSESPTPTASSISTSGTANVGTTTTLSPSPEMVE